MSQNESHYDIPTHLSLCDNHGLLHFTLSSLLIRRDCGKKKSFRLVRCCARFVSVYGYTDFLCSERREEIIRGRLVVPLSWGWEFETCKMRREREREMGGGGDG